jgi:hypothetical protein
MIIKAVFDDLLPITDPEDIRKYKGFMPLETPITKEKLATYSKEDCSENGYYKIMLFYYFFELTKRVDLKTIEGDLQILLDMPTIEEMPQMDEILGELRKRISGQKWFGYKLELGYPDQFPTIITRLLVPLFAEGLYVELNLKPFTYEELHDGEAEASKINEEEGAEEASKIAEEEHTVLIVGVSDKLIIKNTWEEAESSVAFEEIIELEEELFAVDVLYFMFSRDLEKYEFDSFRGAADELYEFISPTKGGKRTKKRKKSKANTKRYNRRLL